MSTKEVVSNLTENYELFHPGDEDHTGQVVYRGTAVLGLVPFTNVPRPEAWGVALPIIDRLAEGIVVDKRGWRSDNWKVRRARANDNVLRITDDSGASMDRTLPWFLEFLQVDYFVGMDWKLTDTWRDAIDGFWQMTRDQQKRIDQLVSEKNHIDRRLINADADRIEAREDRERFCGDRGRLGTAIAVAIEDLLSTKRLGKHGGQASKEAMRIRKELFAVYRDVFGKDHPAVIQLAQRQRTHRDNWKREPLTPAERKQLTQSRRNSDDATVQEETVRDEAAQKIRR